VPVATSGTPVTIEYMRKERYGTEPASGKMAIYTIDFEPLGRRGECQESESILICARQLGVGISSVCGGIGTCNTCRLQVLDGSVSRPTSNELEALSAQELRDGWRLACQTYPRSDLTLNIPPESMTTLQRTQVEGLEVAVQLEPAVQSYQLQLAAPSLSSLQADYDQLLEAMDKQHQIRCGRVDINLLRILSTRLRSWNWECLASIRQDEVIAISPLHSRQLGLAVDLGTTKIAAYLVDLNNGRTLAAKGVMNPQISYGEDIISRITVAINSAQEGEELRQVTVKAINDLIINLCDEVGAGAEEIVDAVVVGNTATHHLFLGLPVGQLAISPFVPAVSSALDVKASDLGLQIAPGAYVHLLPNIAGFVGADHVAMLLATGVLSAEGPVIAIDIGTNTEVSLMNNGEISTVSCASGPAFEGGHIKDGMRATSGAIERLRISGDSIQYQTVDEAPAVGICGSGILDAIAQLHLAGIITKDGRMIKGHSRVRTHKKQRAFVLVSREEREGRPAIVITQQDVRRLQLAKAAIRTGIQVLLETNGCSEEEVKKVIIAGAFGSYIDISSAINIGMLPTLPLDCFQQVGNAAGIGAKLALASLSQRTAAQTIVSRVRYIELASASGFMQTFIQASHLGRYRMANGVRQEID